MTKKNLSNWRLRRVAIRSSRTTATVNHLAESSTNLEACHLDPLWTFQSKRSLLSGLIKPRHASSNSRTQKLPLSEDCKKPLHKAQHLQLIPPKPAVPTSSASKSSSAHRRMSHHAVSPTSRRTHMIYSLARKRLSTKSSPSHLSQSWIWTMQRRRLPTIYWLSCMKWGVWGQSCQLIAIKPGKQAPSPS